LANTKADITAENATLNFGVNKKEKAAR